jgi:hypothetical protein
MLVVLNAIAGLITRTGPSGADEDGGICLALHGQNFVGNMGCVKVLQMFRCP